MSLQKRRFHLGACSSSFNLLSINSLGSILTCRSGLLAFFQSEDLNFFPEELCRLIQSHFSSTDFPSSPGMIHRPARWPMMQELRIDQFRSLGCAPVAFRSTFCQKILQSASVRRTSVSFFLFRYIRNSSTFRKGSVSK